MAQRRITDAAAHPRPARALEQRAEGYVDGDTDLAWTRVTLWRGLLAAALDQPPFEPVTRAVVKGGSDSPSADLLAAWLALQLRCPVTRTRTPAGSGLVSVVLRRPSGPVELVRPDGDVATLNQPGQPQRRIALAARADKDCLAEELRRLDPDEVLEDVIRKGLPLLARGGGARSATKTRSGVRPVRREPQDGASGNGGAREDREQPDPMGTGRQVVPSAGGVTDTPVGGGGVPEQAES
jgi:glucose-6-phosphate dehydrogenase assembly protein OpcA